MKTSQSDWRESPSTEGHVCQPLVGGDVLDVVQVGNGDLLDWMEWVEAVRALCPVWPMRKYPMAKQPEFMLWRTRG